MVMLTWALRSDCSLEDLREDLFTCCALLAPALCAKLCEFLWNWNMTPCSWVLHPSDLLQRMFQSVIGTELALVVCVVCSWVSWESALCFKLKLPHEHILHCNGSDLDRLLNSHVPDLPSLFARSVSLSFSRMKSPSPAFDWYSSIIMGRSSSSSSSSARISVCPLKYSEPDNLASSIFETMFPPTIVSTCDCNFASISFASGFSQIHWRGFSWNWPCPDGTCKATGYELSPLFGEME